MPTPQKQLVYHLAALRAELAEAIADAIDEHMEKENPPYTCTCGWASPYPGSLGGDLIYQHTVEAPQRAALAVIDDWLLDAG